MTKEPFEHEETYPPLGLREQGDEHRQQVVPARLANALNWSMQRTLELPTNQRQADFYIYVHRHPISQKVFYVGKGIDGRAWNMMNRRPEHIEILSQLLREGHPPGCWVSIVRWGLTEREALDQEDGLIQEFTKNGVDLVNRHKPLVETPLPPSVVEATHMKHRVAIALATVSHETPYVPMWVLLRIMKVAGGTQKKAEFIRQIRLAFTLGIKGWFLDEDLYVRRGEEPAFEKNAAP